MDQNTVWKQFMQAVHDEVKLGAGEALQVVYPFSQWNWGGESPVEDSYSYAQWSALNMVPGEPGANKNAQASSSRFDSAFRNWFNSLTLGDLSKDAHYESLQDALAESKNKWTEHIQESMNVYKDQTDNGTDESFSEWLNQAENMPTKLSLNNLQEDYEAKEAELKAYRNRISNPVNSIVTDFENEAYYATVTEPDSGSSIKVRLWDTNPRTPWDYVYNVTNENFKGDATAGTAGSLTFGKNYKKYDFNRVYGGSSFGIPIPFFGSVGENKFEKVDSSKFGDDYSIEISWQDMKTVSISPAGWFSGSDITSYGRGDHYATGFSGFKDGSGNYFFGPGGALSRMYTSLIAMYRPTVTVNAGQEFSHYLYERWESASGVSIGPFFFGREATHIHEASTAKVKSGSFSVTSNDNWPLILGYASKWTLAPES